MSRILLVEDNRWFREDLCQLLAREGGHEVVEAATVADALAAHAAAAFDLIIADVDLGNGARGTELIPEVGKTPVLVITGFATVQNAVEAMKLGAADYLAKPLNHEELLLVVERLAASRLQKLRVAALAKDVDEAWPVEGMIGRCPAMLEVLTLINRIAPTNATVLILGETGTGKELVARAIHNRSPRRDAAFSRRRRAGTAGELVTQNCAAIPKELTEAVLFGHEKGAFTGATTAQPGLFESADGGTLFLDEVGELSEKAQRSLLRVLQDGKVTRVGAPATQERKVNVRLIAATNRDLEQRVKDGFFRKDLYHRLYVMSIVLPPLRERGADIEELACWLLARAAQRLRAGHLELTPEALAAIRAYHWPGNVRELQNAIEHAAILCDTGRVTPKLLRLEDEVRPPTEVEKAVLHPEVASGARGAPFLKSLDEYCRCVVLEHQHHLSEIDLAAALGICRQTLWRFRKRLGLVRRER